MTAIVLQGAAGPQGEGVVRGEFHGLVQGAGRLFQDLGPQGRDPRATQALA